LVQVALMIFIASVFLTVIGQVRQSSDKSLTYVQQLETVISGQKENSRWYDQNVPGDSFIELAHSGRTLNHAMLKVPKEYDYRYGIYALKRILGIFPGLQGVVNSLIDNGDEKYASTSEFISYLIQGEHRTYGDGSSITADLYLDFGFVGVFGGMFIFGYFIGKSEKYAYADTVKYDNILWIAFLIYFSKSLYLSRSSIFLELSYIFLVWVFININESITKSLK
ncbi:O-antigen polysaccharide polymerase Wzy, partial [Vibrio cholerae]|nr:O-antigen polysaccharide polymerase Wzy [Vibrio cholerae]